MKKIILIILTCFKCWPIAQAQTITIKTGDTGRIFEGIGALSAGASSRLLIDYPEPLRSDILDFLFKPKFGANLWQLKVENGGDINSTDGSESAYAHTKEEFLHPKQAYFNRGYEWWLIKEAQKRNPDIRVEILQWGAPAWVDSFYSTLNADFIAGYIKGLEKFKGIKVNYTGIHNEAMYNISWIKLLRQVLDEKGLSEVKIDAGDQWKPDDQWQIARDIFNDPELGKAVYAINAHVPEETGFHLPPEAYKINKPIWSGESHAPGGDWYAAEKMARINNRSYLLGKITKVIYWSLITSYPDFLTAPSSGMMKANTPWSGHYTVQPPLWMYAHINQFARPGWRYVESGCKYFAREGWSVITLKDTASDNYSIIIETMHAKEDQVVHFKLPDNFSRHSLAVWASAFKKFVFERQADISPEGDAFSLRIKPNSVYSLTTTSGQHKGVPPHPIPPEKPFPPVYRNNFDQDSLQGQPFYAIGYHGAFEVVKDKNSDNQILKQCATRQGINWFSQPYPSILFGDTAWKDIKISVDFRIPDTGTVGVEARLHQFSWNSHIPGYSFSIGSDGSWYLKTKDDNKIIKEGRRKPLDGRWHHLQFACVGSKLTVWVDHQQLASIQDEKYKSGIVSLFTGWNIALFDRLKIEALNTGL